MIRVALMVDTRSLGCAVKRQTSGIMRVDYVALLRLAGGTLSGIPHRVPGAIWKRASEWARGQLFLVRGIGSRQSVRAAASREPTEHIAQHPTQQFWIDLSRLCRL